jgi:hypothetical protein
VGLHRTFLPRIVDQRRTGGTHRVGTCAAFPPVVDSDAEPEIAWTLYYPAYTNGVSEAPFHNVIVVRINLMS